MMKMFFGHRPKVLILLSFFIITAFSHLSAQTFTGYNASYYYSDCNSIFNCAGQAGIPNTAGFPGCTSETAPGGGGGNSPAQYIVALGLTEYDGGAHCGQCIQVTDTANGNSVTVEVMDSCQGCDGDSPTRIDLSPSAAYALDAGYQAAGLIPITWQYVSCSAVPTQTPGGPTATFTPTPTYTHTPIPTATFTATIPGTPSLQCASNCSATPSTCTNQEDISQFVSYTGYGYGLCSASTAFPLPAGPPNPSTGSLTLSCIPGGATIVAAYLDMVGVACQNSVTVNGTAFTNGVESGSAVMSTRWINPYPPYNSDPTDWAGWPVNYCNERYTVTSAITGNGAVSLAFPSADEQMTANLFVVYQVPASTTTTTVSLADGLFFWGTGDGNPDVLYAGQAPIMTNLSLCSGACAATPSNATFTRAGGGGIWNTSGGGDYGVGNDVFVSPSDVPSNPNSTTL
jgi:hypothetical protein